MWLDPLLAKYILNIDTGEAPSIIPAQMVQAYSLKKDTYPKKEHGTDRHTQTKKGTVAQH